MPEVAPVLGVAEPRGPVRAVALVLHGGRSSSTEPVRAHQLAVLRMAPFATALRRTGASDGLAVARLRYRARGWNGTQRAPVSDVNWALEQLAARFPGVPIALVGHSMGGRAALYAAAHTDVRAVVALAPWIEPGDPVAQLAGRRVLMVHGALDRRTDPRASAAYAQSARPVAESISYVTIRGERHAMLRRWSLWHELAAGFVAGVLFDRVPAAGRDATDVLGEALAGQAALVV